MPSASDPLADFQFAQRYDVAVTSQRGVGALQRPENQDNFLVIDGDGTATRLQDQALLRTRLDGWLPGRGRVAVLDGMGGHGHGREAAEAVASGLQAIPPCHTAAELTQQLDALHAQLQRRFASEPGARPGTTLTLLELPAGAAPILYHVGDSRLYEIDAAGARPMTVDHVPATVAALGGRIDEREWRRQVHGEHTPQIAQAFILGNAFDRPTQLSDPLYELSAHKLPSWLAGMADRRVLHLREDAVYVLATDGFWSCAAPDAFVARWPALLAGAPDAATIAARLFGVMEDAPPAGLQPDNLTALVLRPLRRHSDETALPSDALC